MKVQKEDLIWNELFDLMRQPNQLLRTTTKFLVGKFGEPCYEVRLCLIVPPSIRILIFLVNRPAFHWTRLIDVIFGSLDGKILQPVERLLSFACFFFSFIDLLTKYRGASLLW
jgi:hypothetical protein